MLGCPLCSLNIIVFIIALVVLFKCYVMLLFVLYRCMVVVYSFYSFYLRGYVMVSKLIFGAVQRISVFSFVAAVLICFGIQAQIAGIFTFGIAGDNDNSQVSFIACVCFVVALGLFFMIDSNFRLIRDLLGLVLEEDDLEDELGSDINEVVDESVKSFR